MSESPKDEELIKEDPDGRVTVQIEVGGRTIRVSERKVGDFQRNEAGKVTEEIRRAIEKNYRGAPNIQAA